MSTTEHPLPEQAEKALDVLRKLTPGCPGVPVKRWARECLERGGLAKAGANRKTCTQAFRRAARALQENGLIEVSNDMTWPAGQAVNGFDRPITMTYFADKEATTKAEKSISLKELADEIRTTNGCVKASLPWLKMGRFGDAPTDAGCLRNDKNVLTVTGIECDYDGEAITPEQGAARLRAAGVQALIYTSPSHTPTKPRWRVLCPTSQELPPDQRFQLVSRLNGALDGILTTESWVLSQAFYYGGVNGNPAPQIELLTGDCIDLRPDLDAGAIGKPDRPEQASAPKARPAGEPVDAVTDSPEYGEAALGGECETVRAAPWGVQQATLNSAAFKCGLQVGRNNVAEERAREELIMAGLQMVNQPGRERWTKGQVTGVVNRGLRQGMDAAAAEVRLPPIQIDLEAMSRNSQARFAAAQEASAQNRIMSGFCPEPDDQKAEGLAEGGVNDNEPGARVAGNERAVPDEIIDVEGALRLFVDWCVATAPSPQPFLALGAGISMIGAVAGRKYRTATNLRTNVYALGITDSGGGKDHPRTSVKEALTNAGLGLYLGGEALASGQGLLAALHRHPSLIFLLDEFGHDLAGYLSPKANAYQRMIWTNLTKLFSSAGTTFIGAEYADQKNNPRVIIRQPCVNVFATSVPRPVWDALKQGSLLDGSAARFLLFVSPNDYPDWNGQPDPFVVPEALIEWLKTITAGADGHDYHGEISMVAESAVDPYTVPMEPAADQLLAELLQEQRERQRKAEEGAPERVTLARRCEHISKLALIRSVSRHPAEPVITALDVRWARLLTDHCQASLLREAARHIADTAAEGRKNDLLEIIRRHRRISKNDLTQKTRRLTARERDEALKDLVEGGEVEVRARESTGGRKTLEYALPRKVAA
jgi:hypothetical protein